MKFFKEQVEVGWKQTGRSCIRTRPREGTSVPYGIRYSKASDLKNASPGGGPDLYRDDGSPRDQGSGQDISSRHSGLGIVDMNQKPIGCPVPAHRIRTWREGEGVSQVDGSLGQQIVVVLSAGGIAGSDQNRGRYHSSVSVNDPRGRVHLGLDVLLDDLGPRGQGGVQLGRGG
jgi:hypothetical protein